MPQIRAQLVEMIDYLPEKDLILLFEIVRRFVPDDVASADDMAAISAAREEYRRGETVSHADIHWD